MGLESRYTPPTETVTTNQPNPSLDGLATYYPYALTNPDIWRAARALAGVSTRWITKHVKSNAKQFRSESNMERILHASKLVAGGTYVVYPLTTDVLTVLVAKNTGNPIIAPLIFGLADAPVLGGAEYAWRKKEGKKRAALQASESLENALILVDDDAIAMTRSGNELESVSVESVLETKDEVLQPHERSLIAKAIHPVIKQVRHGQTITTNLYAGSQAGQLEEMAMISMDNAKATTEDDIHMPRPGWLTAKHIGLFFTENVALASIAASGHNNPTMNAFINLLLTFGLPTYLADRALSIGFNVKPSKSLSYQGYEKIVEMVRNMRTKTEDETVMYDALEDGDEKPHFTRVFPPVSPGDHIERSISENE